MSKSSPAQRKAAPRKTVPQTAPPPTNSKGQPKGQSKGSSKGSGGAKSQPVVKKRGTLLTIALVIMTLDALISAALPFIYNKNTADVNAPWFLAAAVVGGLIGLAGVVLMWYWKRVGIFLYVASVAIAIGLGLILYPSMVVAFHAVIPLLVLGWAFSAEKALPLFE